MGYLLWYEGMFDSVIFAKNKFLKKGGMLFPDLTTISVACVFDTENDMHDHYPFNNVILPNLDYKYEKKTENSNNLIGKFVKLKKMQPSVLIFPKKYVKTTSHVIYDKSLEDL